MTFAKGALALVVAVCLLTASSLASAQTGATLVAIVTSEPNASLTRRVRAELQGLGLDVIVIKPPAESGAMRAPLEQAARSVGAVAAVRLVLSSEGKVEVWVADRVTGKAVVRQLDAPANAGDASDASVALGTVELFRASLMELHSSEPPHGEVAASPKIDALALTIIPPPPTPLLGLTVGGGAVLGQGGVGPSASARLALWVRFGAQSRLGARLIGDTTLAPATVRTAGGSVELRTQFVGLALGYEFADPTATWVPSLSAGVAAAHVSTVGEAVPPYVGTTAATWVAMPFAGAGLAWSITQGLRLRADALGGWAPPAVRVRTPTEDVGRWGAPAIMLSLGVEVLWGR